MCRKIVNIVTQMASETEGGAEMERENIEKQAGEPRDKHE